MLVFQRRPGERLVIGGDTVVTILEASRTRVSVGIEGPQSADREEVADSKYGQGYVARLIARLQANRGMAS